MEKKKEKKLMTGTGPWAIEICKAFGLDPSYNYKITLHVEACVAVYVVAEMYVDENNTEIIDVIKKVVWEEDEGGE